MNKSDLVFSLLKDKYFKNVAELKSQINKLSNNDINVKEMITMIRNYQIDKYGGELRNNLIYYDNKRIAINSANRRKSKYKTKEYY